MPTVYFLTMNKKIPACCAVHALLYKLDSREMYYVWVEYKEYT